VARQADRDTTCLPMCYKRPSQNGEGEKNGDGWVIIDIHTQSLLGQFCAPCSSRGIPTASGSTR
jgi:hypothetical protein